jgi:hypothetical protein
VRPSKEAKVSMMRMVNIRGVGSLGYEVLIVD